MNNNLVPEGIKNGIELKRLRDGEIKEECKNYKIIRNRCTLNCW